MSLIPPAGHPAPRLGGAGSGPRRLASLALVAVALAFSPPATLDGTVVDAATGAPLAGANVFVVGTAIGTATDAAGRFALAGVEGDAATVRVTLVGYAPHTEQIRPAGGASLTVRLVAADVETVVADGGRRRAERGLAMPGAPPPPGTPMMEMGAVSATSGMAGRGASTSSRGVAAPRSESRDDEESLDDRQAQAGVLTAGDVDDGLNWDAFLRYAGRAYQQGSVFRMDEIGDRITLRVVDAAGRPVAGARVRVEATGGTRARRLTTEAGTDGRLALFPRYDFGPGTTRLDLTVTAPGGRGAAQTRRLDLDRLRGDRAVTVELAGRAQRPQALDLAVVLDVTGSMGDEHAYLTDEFEAIVARARRETPDADLRFALVAYRDHGDDFVVRRWDFTRDASEMRTRLAQLSAGGGGDTPEAMDEALEAMLDLDWRTGTAARIAFLVADAPPHANRLDPTMAAVREARARGLRIYPLAASGTDDTAEHVMRTAAVLTQGRYLFLTDDSGVGNPHAEPHVACYEVSRAGDLVARVIESELAGRRVEADPQSLVRTVGSPVAGVCQSEAVTQGQGRRSELEST